MLPVFPDCDPAVFLAGLARAAAPPALALFPARIRAANGARRQALTGALALARLKSLNIAPSKTT